MIEQGKDALGGKIFESPVTIEEKKSVEGAFIFLQTIFFLIKNSHFIEIPIININFIIYSKLLSFSPSN